MNRKSRFSKQKPQTELVYAYFIKMFNLLRTSVKAVTWSKDSHGLFDYEYKHKEIEKYQIKKTTTFLRKSKIFHLSLFFKIMDLKLNKLKKKIYLLLKQTKITQLQSLENLIKQIKIKVFYNIPFILNSLVSYEVLPNKSPSQTNKTYIVVRCIKDDEGQQKGYPLQSGDIIKFGRMGFRIKELLFSSGKFTHCKNKRDPNFKHEKYDQNNEINGKVTCRICLEDKELTGQQDIDDDFLISPCDCKGFQQYVHFSCLQQWTKSKITQEHSDYAIQYTWEKFECEVCKKNLPRKMLIGDEEKQLVKVHRPTCPYIMLENIKGDAQGLNHAIHILKCNKPNNDPILIVITLKLFLLIFYQGRGHQCDARVLDISVSRCHSQIQYFNDQFLLIDNNSKFGSLVLMKEPYVVLNKKIAIQIGRSVITFATKEVEMEPMVTSKNQDLKKLMAQTLNDKLFQQPKPLLIPQKKKKRKRPTNNGHRRQQHNEWISQQEYERLEREFGN